MRGLITRQLRPPLESLLVMHVEAFRHQVRISLFLGSKLHFRCLLAHVRRKSKALRGFTLCVGVKVRVWQRFLGTTEAPCGPPRFCSLTSEDVDVTELRTIKQHISLRNLGRALARSGILLSSAASPLPLDPSAHAHVQKKSFNNQTRQRELGRNAGFPRGTPLS